MFPSTPNGRGKNLSTDYYLSKKSAENQDQSFEQPQELTFPDRWHLNLLGLN
jgi:hypothetical protein